MKTPEEIESALNQMNGTECYYLYTKGFKLTDGVKLMAELTGGFWLLDVIISYQGNEKRLDPDFQVWTLKVDGDKAIVYGKNDIENVVVQEIEYTDFPLKEITVWVEGDVLLLPSER